MDDDRRAAAVARARADTRAARTAERAGDTEQAWRLLKEAHILSQPTASLHIRVHTAMLGMAWRGRHWRELRGQVVRLVLAGPGSLVGRYPVGNTGRADVSAFRPMPVPDDLVPLLPERAAR